MEYIVKQEQVPLIIEGAKDQKYIGLDTETTSLDMLDPKSKILLLQLEINGEAYVIDTRKVNIQPLKEIIESEAITKIVQNAKFDYKFLFTKFGIAIRNIFDTKLAEHLLNAGRPNVNTHLETLVKNYLDYRMDKSTRDSFVGFNNDEFTEEQLEYAAKDVLVLNEIRKKQQMYLKQLGLLPIAELEFALVEPIAQMELTGFKLDTETWRKSLDESRKKLFKLRNELREELPEPPAPLPPKIRYKKDGTPYKNSAKPKPKPVLNLDSWQQVYEAFKKINIDLDYANAHTKKGLTNEATLKFAASMYNDNRSVIVRKLLEYRAFAQVNKTFGDNLISWADENERIHANFHQLGTVAGRLSCSDPNLENIKKKGEDGKMLRSCFIPERNHKFILADYCLSKGSLVSTDKGIMPIELITDDEYVVQENKDFKKIVSVRNSGIKKVNKYVTKHGYVIEATPDHKVRVIDKHGDYVWKRFGDVENTDYVSLLRNTVLIDLPYRFLPSIEFEHYNNNTVIKTPQKLDEELSEFLGYIVGDGSFYQTGIRWVVNSMEADLSDYLYNKAKSLFGYVSSSSPENKGVYTQGLNSKPLARWFSIIGVSKEHVPFDILSSRKSVIAAFLRGLFESDGSVGVGEFGRVSVSSSRYSLMREVQDLLLNIGIVSTLREQSTILNGKKFIAYTISINSAMFDTFEETVGFISNRKRSKLRVLAGNERNYSTQSILFYPNQRDKLLQLPGKDRKCLRSNATKTGRVSFDLAKDIRCSNNQVFNDLELYRMTDYGLYFDKIDSFEYVGYTETYDLQVEDTETFIANGFVVHNSQIHLRIAAEISNDPAMIEAFNFGGDIHRSTASLMFKVSPKSVNSKQRNAAKVINFGLIYGMGENTLSERLDCNLNEAADFLRRYNEVYSTLMSWLDNESSKALERGWARTIKGRYRWFPSLEEGAKDYRKMRSFYERVGKNHPILGTDADMLKTAMVLVHKPLIDSSCSIVNAIHDELVIETPYSITIDTAKIVKRKMIVAGEKFLKKVPVIVDVKIRDNWWKDDDIDDDENGQQYRLF